MKRLIMVVVVTTLLLVSILVGSTAVMANGTSVVIDIKPWSCPNPVNLKSNGKIPVAILSTPSFDATTVDPSTVEFEGASPVHWAVEDVYGNGLLDVVFHFRTKDTNIVPTPGFVQCTLTGETYGGTPIQGTDWVKTVPPES